MRRELDEVLPVLREFFGRMQRAAASHNLHPCVPTVTVFLGVQQWRGVQGVGWGW